jgi:adenosylhomocysteine nucleosidase
MIGKGNLFAAIQTSSDNANEDAAADCMQLVKTVASRYAYQIVMRFCAAVRN